MARSRSEVNADMAPIRRNMIMIGEHLMDEHGVSANNPAGTRPGGFENDRMRIAWLGHYCPKDGWPMRIAEEGQGEITVEVRTEIAAAILARQEAPCAVSNCLGTAGLLKAYTLRREARDALRAELPKEKLGGGSVLEIRPHGLTVEAMSSLGNLIVEG